MVWVSWELEKQAKMKKKSTFVKRQNGILLGKKYYHHELEKQLLLPWVSHFSRNKLSQNDSLAENYTSLGLFLKSVFGNFQTKLPIELHSRSLWIINRKSNMAQKGPLNIYVFFHVNFQNLMLNIGSYSFHYLKIF